MTSDKARAAKKVRNKRLYNEKKRAGLCQLCRKPLDREGVYCSSCNTKVLEKIRKKNAECQARYIARKIAQGLCVDCGKQRDRDGRYCSLCLLKHNERTRLLERGNTSMYPVYRIQALTKLSGGKPHCIRCGCDVYGALELNHKNGGGTWESRHLRPHWKTFQKIVDGTLNLADYEVTCMVCNRTHYAEKKTGHKWKVKYLG